MSVFCYNHDKLLFFPNHCASMWAEENLTDFLIDTNRARDLYQNNSVDPVLVTRSPLSYWTSAYRYCISEENITKVLPTTFRSYLQLGINDFQKYCETGKTTDFTFRSWAGPNVQLNAALNVKKAQLSQYIELNNPDEFYKEMDDFKGRFVSRTRVNSSLNINGIQYEIPDLYNKQGITRRLTMMFNANKFWAGYAGWES